MQQDATSKYLRTLSKFSPGWYYLGHVQSSSSNACFGRGDGTKTVLRFTLRHLRTRLSAGIFNPNCGNNYEFLALNTERAYKWRLGGSARLSQIRILCFDWLIHPGVSYSREIRTK